MTSVREELDEVTATLPGIMAVSGYGTVLPMSTVVAIGKKADISQGMPEQFSAARMSLGRGKSLATRK